MRLFRSTSEKRRVDREAAWLNKLPNKRVAQFGRLYVGEGEREGVERERAARGGHSHTTGDQRVKASTTSGSELLMGLRVKEMLLEPQ